MKIQDITFIIILIIFLFKKDPKYFVLAGLACLVLSIPLFNFWIFFTAQRFVWYAAAFFFIAIIFQLINKHKNSK